MFTVGQLLFYTVEMQQWTGEGKKKNPCLHEAYIIAVQKVNLKIRKYKFRQ